MLGVMSFAEGKCDNGNVGFGADLNKEPSLSPTGVFVSKGARTAMRAYSRPFCLRDGSQKLVSLRKAFPRKPFSDECGRLRGYKGRGLAIDQRLPTSGREPNCSGIRAKLSQLSI